MVERQSVGASVPQPDDVKKEDTQHRYVAACAGHAAQASRFRQHAPSVYALHARQHVSQPVHRTPAACQGHVLLASKGPEDTRQACTLCARASVPPLHDDLLANTCKIHASARQISKKTHFFPVPGEKNAHSRTCATEGSQTPVPPHINVAGEAHEPANADVRVFRPQGWTPCCHTSTLK